LLSCAAESRQIGLLHGNNQMFFNNFFTQDKYEAHRFTDGYSFDFRQYFISLSVVHIAVN